VPLHSVLFRLHSKLSTADARDVSGTTPSSTSFFETYAGLSSAGSTHFDADHEEKQESTFRATPESKSGKIFSTLNAKTAFKLYKNRMGNSAVNPVAYCFVRETLQNL